jgi:hypothetical protein
LVFNGLVDASSMRSNIRNFPLVKITVLRVKNKLNEFGTTFITENFGKNQRV